jgi:hypothetical protein
MDVEISWQLVSNADRNPTALQRHVSYKFETNFSDTDRQADIYLELYNKGVLHF